MGDVTILVACGLKREAAIIRRIGIVPVVGGGSAERLENDVEDAITALGPITAIISSGVAGALNPELKTGEVVVGPLALSAQARDVRLAGLIHGAMPDAHWGGVAGSDAPIGDPKAKAALRTATGADAVDMESHIAARIAARHGLAFSAVRTISDAADVALPAAALVGMGPDGGVALGAVLASLARNPRQLGALMRTGRDASAAFASLARAWAQLGSTLIRA